MFSLYFMDCVFVRRAVMLSTCLCSSAVLCLCYGLICVVFFWGVIGLNVLV